MRNVAETMTLMDRILLVVVSILVGVVLAANPRMGWLSYMDMGDLIQGVATSFFLAAIVWMHRGGKSVVENNTRALEHLGTSLENIEKTTEETAKSLEEHRRQFAGVHGVKS